MAQSKCKKSDIKENLELYFVLLEANRLDETLNFIYPKLYDIVPKATLAESLDEMMTDTTMQIMFTNSTIQEIEDIQKLNGVCYSNVHYTYNMNIHIFDSDPSEPLDLNFMLDMYQGLYGDDNVKLNKDEKSFDVKAKEALIMINDPQYDGWKLLEKKTGLEALLKGLIPDEILNKKTGSTEQK